MVSRSIRAFFVVVLLFCSGAVAHAYVTSPVREATDEYREQGDRSFENRDSVVPPRENVTVVAGQGRDGNAAALVAFDPDGRVRYYDDEYIGYFDVDPVPGQRTTVEYAAERPLTGPRADACNGACTVSSVERVNLTTGEKWVVFSRIIPQARGANWHDADRLGENHLLVGDIHRDGVYLVNTSNGIETWRWNALDDFPITEGGPYPADWAHLNDVEVLADGRYMVSLRNQYQVVFLDEDGLDEEWTLGAEDDHEVLFEQHNPDYVPPERGGPAVVVADSLNDRVVEYRRADGTGAEREKEGGEWERTWTWSDGETVWPRDADRLPNGNTLVADSHGNRVLEVNPDGEVVWEIPFYSAYDVERLGTGDESSGGPSAGEANLRSNASDSDERGIHERFARALFPGKTASGIRFALPMWAGFGELFAVVVAALAALVWGVLELRATTLRVEARFPIRVSRETSDDEHF